MRQNAKWPFYHFFTLNIPIRRLWTNLYHKEDHFLKIWPLLHYFSDIYLKICNFAGFFFLKKHVLKVCFRGFLNVTSFVFFTKYVTHILYFNYCIKFFVLWLNFLQNAQIAYSFYIVMVVKTLQCVFIFTKIDKLISYNSLATIVIWQ